MTTEEKQEVHYSKAGDCDGCKQEVRYTGAIAGKSGDCDGCGKKMKRFGYFYTRLRDRKVFCHACVKQDESAVLVRRNGDVVPIGAQWERTKRAFSDGLEPQVAERLAEVEERRQALVARLAQIPGEPSRHIQEEVASIDYRIEHAGRRRRADMKLDDLNMAMRGLDRLANWVGA